MYEYLHIHKYEITILYGTSKYFNKCITIIIILKILTRLTIKNIYLHGTYILLLDLRSLYIYICMQWLFQRKCVHFMHTQLDTINYK